MSKIQDALSKLKKAEKKPVASIARVQDTQRVPVLTDTVVPASVRQDKEIIVDRDALHERGFLVPETETRLVSEAFRRIKRPLLNNMGKTHREEIPLANILAISSANSGEGKTFTCINLALSIAQERDLSVLLVDGDLLKPELTSLFGTDDEIGLMDVLSDSSINVGDAVLQTDIPQLSFLPAGQRRSLTTELLGSRRMDSLVESLSRQDPDRVVIFDSSPILLASDAVVLTGHVGQIALVVRAGDTLRQEVSQAIEAFDKDKPINLILNQVRLRSKQLNYGYYGYGDNVKAP